MRELLARGADPNGAAEAGGRAWVSCAGASPKPLNCVAIAWGLTENHVEIARLLIEHGAVVDESVRQDHAVESAGGENDRAFVRVISGAG